MRRAFLRTVGLLGVLISQPLSAQERFDISVYPYATAHRGEWELEGHINYASRGTSAFDGSVAPTQGQWRFTAEVSRGITDHWELAGYLLGGQVPGFGLEYAGWRLRSRLRAPESWRLPVNVGFSAEYETARPKFSESARTAELTAVSSAVRALSLNFGRAVSYSALNPTFTGRRHDSGARSRERSRHPAYSSPNPG